MAKPGAVIISTSAEEVSVQATSPELNWLIAGAAPALAVTSSAHTIPCGRTPKNKANPTVRRQHFTISLLERLRKKTPIEFEDTDRFEQD
jgi:hypothetical protein